MSVNLKGALAGGVAGSHLLFTAVSDFSLQAKARRKASAGLFKTKSEGFKACIKNTLSALTCFLRPAVCNIELGEFPLGGLWGVCFEAAANITSQ
jgi:hypothetical protein